MSTGTQAERLRWLKLLHSVEYRWYTEKLTKLTKEAYKGMCKGDETARIEFNLLSRILNLSGSALWQLDNLDRIDKRTEEIKQEGG